MANKHKQYTILHLKHGLTWCLLTLFRCLVLLPTRWQFGLGRGLGKLLHSLFKSRVAIVDKNLQACLPDLDGVQRKQLTQQVFTSVGWCVIEANIAYHMRNKCFSNQFHLKIIGYAHFLKAIASGKGVILLSGHMMMLEIVARIFAQKHRFAVVHRAEDDNVMINRKRAKYLHCIDRNNLKAMVKWLRAGNVLWYAPDQDFGADRSVFSDFMGVQTATLKAIPDLARLGKALVVPAFFRRRQQLGCYESTFFPILKNYPSGDYIADVAQYNQLLGDYIKQHPAQYNWLHRRFKTRPPGEAPFYSV